MSCRNQRDFWIELIWFDWIFHIIVKRDLPSSLHRILPLPSLQHKYSLWKCKNNNTNLKCYLWCNLSFDLPVDTGCCCISLVKGLIVIARKAPGSDLILVRYVCNNPPSPISPHHGIFIDNLNHMKPWPID